MRLLSTLYVADHQARVGVQSRSLLVRLGDGRRQRVPIETIDSVVLVGHGQISSDALALCTDRRVAVTALARSGRVRFRSGGGVTGNVLLRQRQFRAADNPDVALDVSRVIVAGKLANAQRLLRRWTWDAPIKTRRALSRLGTQVRRQVDAVWEARSLDHVRGCEGNGARAYFECLRLHLAGVRPDLAFESRTRRPPRDEVNACLSYCYGLALAELTGAVEGVGLDPAVGFLHGVRPGRPALALDLLEEARIAVVDRFVVRIVGRRIIGPEDFVSAVGGGKYLSDSGRAQLLIAWEEYRTEEIRHELLDRSLPRAALSIVQATLMARFLRGDLPSYAPYVMPG